MSTQIPAVSNMSVTSVRSGGKKTKTNPTDSGSTVYTVTVDLESVEGVDNKITLIVHYKMSCLATHLRKVRMQGKNGRTLKFNL